MLNDSFALSLADWLSFNSDASRSEVLAESDAVSKRSASETLVDSEVLRRESLAERLSDSCTSRVDVLVLCEAAV
ncbi:hypothetical protein SUT286_20570 [Streptococcus parasuis]|nr:hypothetical protein SUT286_20570 [Streptococcus parasuis]